MSKRRLRTYYVILLACGIATLTASFDQVNYFLSIFGCIFVITGAYLYTTDMHDTT